MRRLCLIVLLLGACEGRDDDDPRFDTVFLASSVVPPTGGVVEVTDPEFFGTRIEVPPIPEPLTITISRVIGLLPESVHVFEFRPTEVEIEPFVRITITYSEEYLADLGLPSDAPMVPLRLDGTEPVFVERQDVGARTVTFTTRRLGRFATVTAADRS
jgi:hypothetical protein